MPRISRRTRMLPFAILPALGIGTALGSPGDVSGAGTPPVQVGASAPRSSAENRLVSSSGEASYRIAFQVPPGRNGWQPSVELVYGSRAPLRGGVAAGWSLPLSRIHVDTTAGRTGALSYAIDGQRLIPSGEAPGTPGGTTYRAHGDDAYTIYEHVSDGSAAGTWRAHAMDGSVVEYGTAPNSRDVADPADTGPQYGTQGRWFVSRSVDARGNEILYSYAAVTGSAHDGQLPSTTVDRVLASIQYGRNVNAPASVHVAKIDFVYSAGTDLCAGSGSAVPIGAQFDFRTGLRLYEGAAKLLAIRASVGNAATGVWTRRSELALAYDPSAAACNQPHAPLRVLASTTLTAWDAAGQNPVTLPTTSFRYGPQDYDFADSGQNVEGRFGSGGSISGPNASFPTTDTTTADLTGNGILAELTPTPWSFRTSNGCRLGNIIAPGLTWANLIGPDNSDPSVLETCSASMQLVHHTDNVTPRPPTTCSFAQQLNHERLVDLTGDGLPDLVTQLSYEGAYFDPALIRPGEYASCDVMPQQPCTSPDGSPTPCLFDPSQTMLGARGMGITRGSGETVPLQGQPSPCAIVPDMRCGYYVLRFYQNLGQGLFAATPTIIYSPIPLETAEHQSRLDNGSLATASEFHGFVDVDGDGVLDAVYQVPAIGGSLDPIYHVWRGDGTGQFSRQRLDWVGPQGAVGINKRQVQPSEDDAGHVFPDRPQSEAVTTLQDINGDGLPDLVHSELATASSRTGRLLVNYNTGNGFESVATSLDVQTVPSQPFVAWLSASVLMPFGQDPDTHETMHGYAVATRRPLDFDGDGLIDVATTPPPSGSELGPYEGAKLVTPYINVGDKLIPATLSPAMAARWYPSVRNATVYQDGTIGHSRWRIASDIVDRNGDGLPELQELTNQGQCSDPFYAACGDARMWQARPLPYRLLTQVDNGLGVTMSFTYTSVRDATAVTTVTTDARHRVQAPMSVVRELDIASPTAPTATTTYAYQDPLTAPDAFGRADFRGFEQITERGPIAESGARRTTIRRYDFSVDPAGREREVLTLDTGVLASVSRTTWIELDTTGGARSYVPAETLAYTCSPRSETIDQAEADCVQVDGKLERHVSSWTPIHPADIHVPGTPSSVPAIGFVRTLDLRTGTTGARQVGDRGDATTFDVHYAPGQWLVLNRDTRTLAAITAGTFTGATILAHTITTYDTAGRGLPVLGQVEVAPGVFATTIRSYDAFGNVATTMRPNQQAGQRLTRSTTYDTFGMYPIAIVDELGHRVEQDWDLGLGVITERRGPLQGSVMPREHTSHDAFGRAVQRTRLAIVGNSPPADVVIYTAAYSDTLTDHSVLQASRIDYSNAVWKQTRQTLDGFGRVIREAQITGPTTAETTTRRYDAAGNVVETVVPDPSASSGTVSYTARHDGLGRVIGQTAPARAPRGTIYAGLVTTTGDLAGDGSLINTKVTEHDAFGRLVRVVEGAATRATTVYTYDALDRMTHISDADGVATDLAYRLGGERASVTRAGSVLAYDYDLDGNRVAVHHPRPGGVTATDPAWISSWSYDALDRVVVAQPATRALSGADQARFLTGATTNIYDEASHAFGNGRLTTVAYPFGTVSYGYTIEGWVASETRDLHVAPDGTTLAAGGTLSTSYSPLGEPVITTYPDDATAPTSARIIYDLQARPNRLDVGQNGNNFRLGLAILGRNPAGLVATRTAVGNPSVEQTFHYDAAGRVTDHSIAGLATAGGATTTLAGETLAFTPYGDVSAFTDRAKSRTLTLGYDDVHELVTAASSPAGHYAAALAYSPTGKVISASVQSSLAGAQIANRNVVYDFARAGSTDLADPAAVRRLVGGGGSTFASFAYDPSSNLLSRTVGTATTNFGYDGNDWLREARTANGDEVYYYDHAGERILTYRAASGGRPASLRHRFATTEITTDTAGGRTTTTDLPLGGHPVVRVTNHDIAAPRTLYHGVLGNLLAVLDAGKVMRARYGFGPYGELLYAEGPDAAGFDHTYEDKARDALTGLSYFGKRYYDPLTLTWTQADPLFRFAPDLVYTQPRRMAPFGYVLDNPLRYVDPDGRSPNPPPSPAPGAKPRVGQCVAIDGCGYTQSWSRDKSDGGSKQNDALAGVEDASRSIVNAVIDALAVTVNEVADAGNNLFVFGVRPPTPMELTLFVSHLALITRHQKWIHDIGQLARNITMHNEFVRVHGDHTQYIKGISKEEAAADYAREIERRLAVDRANGTYPDLDDLTDLLDAFREIARGIKEGGGTLGIEVPAPLGREASGEIEARPVE